MRTAMFAVLINSVMVAMVLAVSAETGCADRSMSPAEMIAIRAGDKGACGGATDCCGATGVYDNCGKPEGSGTCGKKEQSTGWKPCNVQLNGDGCRYDEPHVVCCKTYGGIYGWVYHVPAPPGEPYWSYECCCNSNPSQIAELLSCYNR